MPQHSALASDWRQSGRRWVLGDLAMALTDAKATSVNDLTCCWGLPLLLAIPARTSFTPAVSVGSSRPLARYIRARAARCSRTVATDSPWSASPARKAATFRYFPARTNVAEV